MISYITKTQSKIDQGSLSIEVLASTIIEIARSETLSFKLIVLVFQIIGFVKTQPILRNKMKIYYSEICRMLLMGDLLHFH